jgi:hypothetical protein
MIENPSITASDTTARPGARSSPFQGRGLQESSVAVFHQSSLTRASTTLGAAPYTIPAEGGGCMLAWAPTMFLMTLTGGRTRCSRT